MVVCYCGTCDEYFLLCVGLCFELCGVCGFFIVMWLKSALHSAIHSTGKNSFLKPILNRFSQMTIRFKAQDLLFNMHTRSLYYIYKYIISISISISIYTMSIRGPKNGKNVAENCRS